MISSFLFLILAAEQTNDLKTLLRFEEPDGEEYLSLAFSSSIAPNDKLYVIDPSQPRVLVWHGDGRFEKGFGTEGEGPGELRRPIQIATGDEGIYVWQRNGRVTAFDFDGGYRRSFLMSRIEPRRFAVLTDDRFLTAQQIFADNGRVFCAFTLYDGKGTLIRELKRDPHQGFLQVGEGTNNVEIRAFMGDVDVQRIKRGSAWLGYGYQRTITRVDASGRVLEEKRFDLPASQPSDEERRAIESKEVITNEGRTIRLEDLPNLRIRFDTDKGFYCHFVVRGDRVALVLTDQGGSEGIGDGAARATYFVNDLHTGKLLARGAYQLADDSQVHYRDGRIIAFAIDEDGGYAISEVTLRGLEP